ncbi:MAG TPA: phage baseplate assembly protein V [Rhizomicrobium sp.]
MSRRTGVVTAFVKSVDAQQGRVKVEYRNIADDLSSSWAPVASAMSGKSRGALFMPEEGDEVLVAFENGDFDHPFVLGFLWNGEQVSPEDSPKNRVIVTPGGHQLRFEDKSGDARVVLKSKGGHSITLDDKDPKKLEIKSTQSSILLDDTSGAEKISIKAGSGGMVSIEMSATPQSITISTGAGSISIDSSGVTVTSPASLTINAPAAATINCASATITASGTASITAPALSVNAAMATFSGVLQCTTLITNSVVSPTYTPGIGNMI